MCKPPVCWCPWDPRTNNYEISAARRKKSTVERYIAASGRSAVAMPLCACTYPPVTEAPKEKQK